MSFKVFLEFGPKLTSGPMTPEWLVVDVNHSMLLNVFLIEGLEVTTGPFTAVLLAPDVNRFQVIFQSMSRFERFIASIERTLELVFSARMAVHMALEVTLGNSSILTSGPIACERLLSRMRSLMSFQFVRQVCAEVTAEVIATISLLLMTYRYVFIQIVWITGLILTPSVFTPYYLILVLLVDVLDVISKLSIVDELFTAADIRTLVNAVKLFALL